MSVDKLEPELFQFLAGSRGAQTGLLDRFEGLFAVILLLAKLLEASVARVAG